MIVALAGENSFALRHALDQRVAAFIAEHGEIAVERLDGAEADIERIRASLQSAPFLAARKLVILRNPGNSKQFTEQAEALLSSVAGTTDLLVVEAKVDKRSSYYKFLKKTANLEEFPEMDEQGLARWLSGAAKERGGSLGAGDARLLIERTGASQQLLASELEKLLLYNPKVTQGTIELLVDAAPQSKVFDLLEAAFAGNTARAVALYRDQREQKIDPSQIIAMLAWQLRILALLMTAAGHSPHEVVHEAKLSPYTVQKSMAIAKRLTLAQLKKLVSDLLEIDARSKRENIDLDEALQNYLLQIGRTTS